VVAGRAGGEESMQPPPGRETEAAAGGGAEGRPLKLRGRAGGSIGSRYGPWEWRWEDRDDAGGTTEGFDQFLSHTGKPSATRSTSSDGHKTSAQTDR
jgi:hypothetical protein